MANHEFRSTGRSTRRAFSTAMQALNNVQTWITCIDHNDLLDSHRTLAQDVSSLLSTAGVAHEVDGNRIKVKPIKKSRG